MLRLLTLTEEHETGASHVVKTVGYFLDSRVTVGLLLRTSFIALDNTSKENNNRSLLTTANVSCGSKSLIKYR